MVDNILILLLLISLLTSCEQDKPIVQSTSSFQKGIGFWPTQVTAEYQNMWFEKLVEGNMQILAIQKGEPFTEPANDDPSNYNTILNKWLESKKSAAYKTYIGLEPFTGDRRELDTPPGWSQPPEITDKNWQELYNKIILDNVNRHKPDYLNPCIEVNMWYMHATPEEWQEFRRFYSRIYSDVKKVSPTTKIFCSLQYDLISGQMYQNPTVQWELLDNSDLALPNQDLLGISTYPYGDLKTWYDGLRSRQTKPLFIAEIGWISFSNSASEQKKQKEFMQLLPTAFEGLNVEAVLWLTLADLDPAVVPGLPDTLYHTGLMEKDFTPKDAWNVWKTI